MPSRFWAFMALSTSSTLPPLVRVMPYLSSRFATSWEKGPPLPAQITNTYLAPALVLERADDLLDGRGEVGGVARRVLLVDHLGAELLDGRLVGGDAVAAEGVVLGDGGDGHAGLGHGQRVGDGVLPRVPAGAEDVAVPVLAGDAVGHGGLDDQDLLELLRPPAGWPAPRR